MNLDKLLLFHAIVTCLAGVVLIVAPYQIPKTVAIKLQPDAYLFCYLLGSAELAIAFLSYHTRNLTDAKSRRLVAQTFVVIHAITAAVELYAFTQGTGAKILGNVLLRALIVFLFWFYGIRKKTTQIHSE